DKGNRYAKYLLGKAYLDGVVLLQNIPEAIRLLTESADKHFAPAQYILGKLLYRGEIIPQDLERAVGYLERAAAQDNPYAAYFAGKILLTEDGVKDVLRAIRYFEIAAKNGNNFAEYQLGKLYLYGKETEQDYSKAVFYLSAASEHGNRYAQQLLHSIKSSRNWSAALGTIRLLHHLSRTIQNRLEDERKGKGVAIDRKQKRKIDEKKQAHGLRQG
ncbi:MAG: tetratricopeptide repeat protein, partial [Acutalibacteraceae bacterium]